jgi:hypothetical protein
LCPAAVAIHVLPPCFGKRFPLDRPRALPQGAR